MYHTHSSGLARISTKPRHGMSLNKDMLESISLYVHTTVMQRLNMINFTNTFVAFPPEATCELIQNPLGETLLSRIEK